MTSNPIIHLSQFQTEMIQSPARFKVAVCGRRSGKSTVARIKAYKFAVENPGSRTWLVAKTYTQAYSLYWEQFVGEGRNVGTGKADRLFPEMLVKEVQKSNLTITLINGSVIQLKGSDSPDSLLGEGLDLLIFDEFQSQSPSVWYKLYPMISDTGGEVWIIGTPRGYNHLYDRWYLGAPDNPTPSRGWRSWLVTTETAGQVAPDEIDLARGNMSSKEFAQEYLASFENLSGVVYDAYDPQLNSRDDITLIGDNINKPLLVGVDFNVNPITASVAVLSGTELHVCDEIYIENSNTRELIQEIKKRYPGRAIICYPDPSGSRRQTSAPSDDHTLLREAGFSVKARPKHPTVKQRINAVNGMFCNANGVRKLYVHPRCQHLIKGIRGLTYNAKGEPDKSLGLDHITDALGYNVELLVNGAGGGGQTNAFGY